jgi:hypothetical protein
VFPAPGFPFPTFSSLSLPLPLITMNQPLSLLLLLVATSWGVSAAIGPSADLQIVNQNLAPDGFNRSFVFLAFLSFLSLTFSTITSALYSLEVPSRDR